MTINRSVLLGIFSIALLCFTGCVGPMAHGPLGGCCGPAVASNDCACNGCGELYVDPWINHPADCVDPCDMCGNYNGQSCGRCRPMFEGIRSLWGYRCGPQCGGCDDPGCAVECSGGFLGGGCGTPCSCGGGCDAGCTDVCSDGCSSCGGGEVLYGDSGQVIHDGEFIVEGDPTIEGTQLAPSNQPYKPDRTRKIFNPRPRVATGDNRSVGY